MERNNENTFNLSPLLNMQKPNFDSNYFPMSGVEKGNFPLSFKYLGRLLGKTDEMSILKKEKQERMEKPRNKNQSLIDQTKFPLCALPYSSSYFISS